MLLVACERGARPASDTTAVVPVAAPADSVAVSRAAPVADGAQPICPNTGLWMPCSVIYRLERAGLAPARDSNPVTEAPLQFPGILLRLGRAELELYIYESASARERDQSRLDASKYVVYPAPMPMQPVPTLVTSANLIAILHSRNDHLRERISDAITAGPPQPPSSRP